MLNDAQFNLAKSLIISTIRENSGLELNDLVATYELPGLNIEDEDRRRLIEEITQAWEYQRIYDTVIVTDPTVIRDQRNHEEWYGGWLEENDENTDARYYWTQMKNLMKEKLGNIYDEEHVAHIIKSIDKSTDGVISDMESPTRPRFISKGLVLGYVQSGKTSNFTGVIAKACDAGYKFIIVLTGIHDVLRKQTQVRLDKELTGVRETAEPESEYVTFPPFPRQWERLTSAPESIRSGEFSLQGLDPFINKIQSPRPIIAIIKKNTIVMRKIINWINETINDDARNSIPFLLIDDEADLASVNIGSLTEVTATNQCIRDLMGIFTKSSYLAYTATPFSNFFIPRDATDDLYPRNFIYSLPKPEDYFGAAMIFDSTININYIKTINRGGRMRPPEQDDVNQLIGSGEYAIPEIPVSLINAIQCFMFGCAIRCLRGDDDQPMSMLIHVHWRVGEQENIYNLVTRYYRNFKTQFRSGVRRGELIAQLNEQWNEYSADCQRITSFIDIPNILPEFDEVIEQIETILNSDEEIKILVLNYRSDDELDYTRPVKPKVIAIGGNKLSRGLTLEGLMTSYYARESRQYDTLLQMGRWFGYRKGYEDLTRVWTTPRLQTWYQHISLVEEEMRTNLSIYEEEGVTPADIPVLVRDHQTLNVTAKNKLGAALTTKSSYSYSNSQTFKLPLNDEELINHNISISTDFIEALLEEYTESSEDQNPNYLFLNIPARFVLERFFYRFRSYDCGFDYDDLIQYINRRVGEGEYQDWNIGIKSLKTTRTEEIEWGGLRIKMIERSKKRQHLIHGVHHIGVLTDRYDRVMDLGPNYEQRPPDSPPLLMLYRIWGGSQFRGEGNGRVALYKGVEAEQLDPVGIAIYTPESILEPHNFIGQIFFD